MIKIWDKYIIKRFIFIFCLLLFGFYGIFILLDFATHASYFPRTMENRFLNIIYFNCVVVIVFLFFAMFLHNTIVKENS